MRTIDTAIPKRSPRTIAAVAGIVLLCGAATAAADRTSRLSPGTYSINVDHEDCVKAGLPAVEVRYQVNHSELGIKYYGQKNTYVVMTSAKKATPHGVFLFGHRDKKVGKKGMRAAVVARYGKKTVKVGRLETVGTGWPDRKTPVKALSFTARDKGKLITGCIAALGPHGAKRSGVYLQVWTVAKDKKRVSCAKLSNTHPFNAIFRTLRFKLAAKK